MNWLQMGETWVDVDKVYAVRKWATDSGEKFYELMTTGGSIHIREADAAPLLAWLEAHKEGERETADAQDYIEIMTARTVVYNIYAIFKDEHDNTRKLADIWLLVSKYMEQIKRLREQDAEDQS